MTAMEGELEPLDPAPPAVSQRPWARVAGVSVGALLGVAALTAVAVSSTWRVQPREADLGAETVEFFRRGGDDRRPAKHHHKEQSVDSESESESSSGGSTSCSAVTCAPYGEAKSGDHTCDGDPTSDACINKCCKEVECSSLGSGFCSSLGPDYSERKISFFERGLPQRTGKCRGEADCEDACCQNLCSGFTCPSGTCPSKFPPTKCTKSECQLQCCVQQQKYCGGGFNAYTAACYACESTESYCEAKLGVTRSAVSTKEWNKKAFAAVEAGTVEPGCEISKHYVPTCQSELKYTLTSQFSLHKTSEAVSVNTVAVIPGGFAALSGGDDQQVYEWTIANGGPLHNFSGAASPVVQVAALNDATYFCAASHTEAIVWLLQPRYGEEIQGQSELPMDTREGAPPVGNTGCIGLNTWETVLVGQNNSFAVPPGMEASVRPAFLGPVHCPLSPFYALSLWKGSNSHKPSPWLGKQMFPECSWDCQRQSVVCSPLRPSANVSMFGTLSG
ncbi:unnamed protein product [Effrenium voratum]|nr:unnamed protein product [Effrenium voratum]